MQSRPICTVLTEEELFLEMLDNLASEKDKDPLGIFASRLATMACKAAVKGNHQMSDQEANALIDELADTGESLSLSSWKTDDYFHD